MLTFGGLMWRRPPAEFRMKSEYGHVAGTTLEDWPVSYDDLEPHFTKAEYEMGGSGEGGVNPFEGNRSKPFPLPPIELQPGDELIRSVAKRKGYHAFVAPLGILTKEYRGRNPCVQHPCCNGYACETGAKSTPVTALLPDALASGNCELVPNALVNQITVDARGDPNGVEYFHEGKRIEQPARLTILASFPIWTRADVREWLPGDAVFDDTLHLPHGVKPGTYQLRIALVDPRAREPAIRLAIEGRQPDGWYQLGEVEVR